MSWNTGAEEDAGAAAEGAGGGLQLGLGDYDVVLTSYETFRQELGRGDSSLCQLGFWRIVKDWVEVHIRPATLHVCIYTCTVYVRPAPRTSTCPPRCLYM